MEKRELICIGCPMGCPLTVQLDDGEILSITGQTCKRGDPFSYDLFMFWVCLAVGRW